MMPIADTTPIQIERAMEQLRQEREVFDQRKSQESRWFVLRLIMGYSSVLLLFAVIVICAIVLFNSEKFPVFTVQAAGAALFADVLGLLIGVWKIVLKPDFVTKLAPETKQVIGTQQESSSGVVPPLANGPTDDRLKPICLHAKDAQLHGTVIQYEHDEVMDNIGYWTSKDDYVSWKFHVPHPTSFSVVVEQACRRGCGGEYAVVIGSGRLPAKVAETATWQNFTRCQLGHISIPKAGEYTLKVEALRIQGEALMNLRTLTLHPISLK